jgi:hypothetical protein
MPGFLGGSSGSSGAGGEIIFPKEFIDPVTKLRVSQPENLIDTDFEYGLQPTKWETVELINNTPSFFSKSGDTTIPNIVSISTNSGTREITVVTATDHGLAVGIPINVTGTKSVTADGSFIINSIPNTFTFTYLCKDEQIGNNSIEDLYSSIITGEFFQGSQIRVADAEGVTTDAEAISTLTVKTDSTHGFGINTPFYFLNLNSTISQEFEASNTAAKSFDSSNSATAQTFDGSNTLSTFNIDWSNSAVVGGTTSTISSVNTTNDTITVSHGAETFAAQPLGTPLYYNLTVPASSGYFFTNPRGVVFLKTINALNSPAGSSTFQVSATPDGDVIDIVSSMSGTIQLANQARTFAGNNLNPLTQTALTVIRDSAIVFDGANEGFSGLNGVCTVEGYSSTILVSVTAGAGLNYYVGAMVRYATTGAAASGLTNNETYFISTFVTTATPNQYRITLKALPNSVSEIVPSGGSGTQTFTQIGISTTKDIIHLRNSNYVAKDMLEYSFPVGGRFSASSVAEEKLYYFVQTAYDAHNYQVSEAPVNFVEATGGVVTNIVSRATPYRVHTFATVGNTNFVVSSGGAVEYLVIGGGGGGGGGAGGGGGGGGGAGGYRSSIAGETTGGGGAAETPLTLTAGTYVITVGAAGVGRSGSSGWTNGGDSVFSTVTATGGGRGGMQANYAGGTGGSGGGGGGGDGGGVQANTGGARTASPIQGFAGGRGGHTGGTALGGGGGGGAGAAGTDWSNEVGGNGGDGLASQATGTWIVRAGGGGGSQNTNTGVRNFGVGGTGGGGVGGYTSAAGAGATNTGSGGGGGSHPSDQAGANGGSGIVILRYPTAVTALASPTAATGGTTSTQVIGDTTYRVHAFTATGTSTFTVSNAGNLGPAEVLIVGGGGSGGVDCGGGGGGGGVIQASVNLSATSYSIVVGAGGAARPGTSDDGPGNGGQNSTAFGLTALGGAGGTGWANAGVPSNPNGTGINGGSGSGQAVAGVGGTLNPQGVGTGLQPGSASGGFGNNGGGAVAGFAGGGGGGGSAGQAGRSGVPGVGGLGYLPYRSLGAGYAASTGGRFAAGGTGGLDYAGGSRASSVPSNNGVAKQSIDNPETASEANTGHGGHGANHNDRTSGAGGSGIVIVRYPISITGL